MRNSLICLLALILFGSVAYARSSDDNGSEFQHQAPDGTFELTPRADYQDLITKYTPASSISQMQETGTDETLTAEYGLSKNFSFGVGGQYESLKTTYTPTGLANDFNTTGMMDPWVYLNARAMLGSASLHFGVKYSASSDQTIDTKGNYNGFSGGPTGTIYGGLEFDVLGGYFGIYGEDDVYKPNETQNDSSSGTMTTNKISGGALTKVSAYYEVGARPVNLGIAVEMIKSSDQTQTAANGTVSDLGDAYTQLAYDVYVPLYLGSSVTIIPMIEYDSVKFDNASALNLASVSGFAGHVLLRLAF